MTIANIQTNVNKVIRGQTRANAPNSKFSIPDIIIEPDNLCNKFFMAIYFMGYEAAQPLAEFRYGRLKKACRILKVTVQLPVPPTGKPVN